jgi:hypothetical protein
MTNQAFAEYFRLRGGTRILGFPISRSFTLEGFEVQFFQRVVLQLQGGQVQRMNILDPGVMPMTRANQSQFPGPDESIAARAPQVGASDYAQQVVNFVKQVSPDTFNGQQVGFFNLFNTTVPVDIAFAGQTPNPDLVTLLNLEIWGLPTSNPAPDPGNGGFIYQRYQRGIMHYDASCGCTQGILVGEYLKAVITGKNLPTDLGQDMQGSKYLNQYSPGSPGWVARPAELPNTDMNGAFEQGTGNVPQPPAPAPTQPSGAATATPTATGTAVAGPTITLQVDDDRIDPGQTIAVTVIGRYATPIDWVEFEGVSGDNNNDNDAIVDAALARQRFDCDDRTECATVWNVTPSISGDVTLRARGRGTDGVRSDWQTLTLRVRGNSTATATPGTPTITPTPVVVTATPTTAAATATPTTAAGLQPGEVTPTPTMVPNSAP